MVRETNRFWYPSRRSLVSLAGQAAATGQYVRRVLVKITS
jgi:hypothetical protein